MLPAWWPSSSDATVEIKPASNLAESEVRKQLQTIVPPKTRVASVVEEGAWLKPFDCNLLVTYKEYPDELTVTSKKISVQFKGGKVTVMGARDVRLYTSVGLRFVNRSHTDFTLDYISGITTLLGSGTENWFLYGKRGEAFFVLDQPNSVVKVWAPDIGYDLVKGGNVHFCVLEPRPEVKVPDKIGELQLRLQL